MKKTALKGRVTVVSAAYITFSVNKCCGGCSTTDEPHARVCVSNKVINMNVKVFNLMPEVNKTRILVRHESYECKCRLNESM